MKKIIITGNPGEALKSLNTFLSGKYKTQICSDNPTILCGMAEIVKPDLVIIFSEDPDSGTFDKIRKEFPELPILIVGNVVTTEDGKQISAVPFPSENSEILKAIEARIGKGEQSENAKKTVMVIDDNPMLLRSIRPVLQKEYDVMIAASGAQALNALKRKLPDLILLDYEMPECDGPQTLHKIRENEESTAIPVIFVTGVSDKERIDHIESLGVRGYVIKPYVPEELMGKIAEVLK